MLRALVPLALVAACGGTEVLIVEVSPDGEVLEIDGSVAPLSTPLEDGAVANAEDAALNAVRDAGVSVADAATKVDETVPDALIEVLDAGDGVDASKDAGDDADRDAGVDAGAPPRTSCNYDSADDNGNDVPDDCEVCPVSGCLPIVAAYLGEAQDWGPLEAAKAIAQGRVDGRPQEPALTLEAPSNRRAQGFIAVFEDPDFVDDLLTGKYDGLWFGLSVRTIGFTDFNAGIGAFAPSPGLPIPPAGRERYFVRAILAPNGTLSSDYTDDDASAASVVWTIHASEQ